jgi:hypothetical protein
VIARHYHNCARIERGPRLKTTLHDLERTIVPAQVLRAMALQEKIGRSTLIAAGRVAAGQGSGEFRAAIRPGGIGGSWGSVESARRSGSRSRTVIGGVEPLCSLTGLILACQPNQAKAKSSLRTATGVMASPDLARAPLPQSTINPLRENGAPERRS